jgi:hypothetical protein
LSHNHRQGKEANRKYKTRMLAQGIYSLLHCTIRGYCII